MNWTHPSDFAEGRPNGAQPERTIVTPKLRFFERVFFGKEEVCDKMRGNHCKNREKWDDFHTFTTLDIHLVMGPYHCIIDSESLLAKGWEEKPSIFT